MDFGSILVSAIVLISSIFGATPHAAQQAVDQTAVVQQNISKTVIGTPSTIAIEKPVPATSVMTSATELSVRATKMGFPLEKAQELCTSNGGTFFSSEHYVSCKHFLMSIFCSDPRANQVKQACDSVNGTYSCSGEIVSCSI